MLKIIFFLFLAPAFLFAQANSKFIYAITVIENKESKMMEMMESISPNYINLANSINFTLLTDRNNQSSSFKVIEKTIPDDASVKLFLTMSDYSGQINQKYDSLYIEKNFDHYYRKYTVKDTINKKWQIYSESKEKFGYKCYKAKCTKTVINEKGIFKNDVIAWFCPEIPFQFGPLGYGKLPGLIFELQTKYALFGIKSIVLDSNEAIMKVDNKRVLIKKEDFENIALQHILERKLSLEKK